MDYERTPLFHRKPIIITLNVIVWTLITLMIRNGMLDSTSADTRSLLVTVAGLQYGALIGFNAYVNIPNFPLLRIALMGALWAVGFVSILALSPFLCVAVGVMLFIGSALLINNRDLIERQITAFASAIVLLIPYVAVLVAINDLSLDINPTVLGSIVIAGFIIGLLHGFVFTSNEINVSSQKRKSVDEDSEDTFAVIDDAIPDTGLFYDDDQDKQRQSR